MNFENLIAHLKKYNILQYFYFLFGLAIIARVICDLIQGRMEIHAGLVFPTRKLNPDTLPYSLTIYFLEIGLCLLGASLIIFKKVRWGSAFVVLGYLMGLTQLLQHQKILILIVASTLWISPASLENRHSIWFLRCQLIIVYGYSFLHKALNEFYNGEVMKTVINYHLSLDNSFFTHSLLSWAIVPVATAILSALTLTLELIIPLVLIKKPAWGFLLVILFHSFLNLIMSNIFPFGLTMIALALLFLMDVRNESLVLDK